MRFIPCGRAIGSLAILAALPGCCTMARLFCGPDQTPWVSVEFDTPAKALATFREAARRDDAIVAFRCLSEDFKQRTGLKGVVEATIAWEKLKDQVTGLHLLGYADVSAPEPLPDGRIAYVLDVSGHRLRVRLVRQAYWEVRWTPGSTPDEVREDGRYVPDLGGLVLTRDDPAEGTTQVGAVLPPADVAELTRDRIVGATVGHLWKVDDLEPLKAEDPSFGPD